jgi:hypothetical protein
MRNCCRRRRNISAGPASVEHPTAQDQLRPWLPLAAGIHHDRSVRRVVNERLGEGVSRRLAVLRVVDNAVSHQHDILAAMLASQLVLAIGQRARGFAELFP